MNVFLRFYQYSRKLNIFASVILNQTAFPMLKFLKQTIIFISFCYLFSSCITSRKINYMQPPGFNIPAYKDSLSFEDYKLRIGDRITMKIYSTDNQTNAFFNNSTGNSPMGSGSGGTMDLNSYLIEKNGTINLPMIGEVQLVGQTAREATSTLEKSIESLFKFSTVEIRIVNRNFSIIGNGEASYIAIPQEKINIFKALAMAGDLGVYADRSKIRVLRETDNGVQIKTFDLRSSDIIHSEFFYIEPNDVIYIQTINERFFSITNLPSLVSTTVSTFSFGVILYDAYKKITVKNPQ